MVLPKNKSTCDDDTQSRKPDTGSKVTKLDDISHLFVRALLIPCLGISSILAGELEWVGLTNAYIIFTQIFCTLHWFGPLPAQT
jgi:hypothetical protein